MFYPVSIYASQQHFQDRTVRIWQLHQGQFVCTGLGVGHTEHVSAVALSPAKTHHFFVSCSKDTTLKLWPLPVTDGKVHAKYTHVAHAKEINAVAVSPNGKFIATASQDRTAKVGVFK